MQIKFKQDMELTVSYPGESNDVEIFHEGEVFGVDIRIVFYDGSYAYLSDQNIKYVEFIPPMKLTLVCGPEGYPNFCFGTYNENGESVDFVQNDYDYPGLAQKLGAELPDPDEVERGVYLISAYDWLVKNAGKTFKVVNDSSS